MIFLTWFWFLLSAYMLYCVWDNTRLFVKPPELNRKRKKWPFVSILIPARNEESRIEPCIQGMIQQDYPSYEILVLDDQSSDRTLNVVQAYANRNPRLRVYRGKPLPKSWLGKSWACYQLSRKAKGDWFLFTDADTWHRPEMLKRTVQMAEQREADVLTLLTRQVTKTWMEILVIPVMAFTLLAFLPARWSLRKKSRFNRFAGVSGQFLFIRKKVYEAIGGHERVKAEIVEDLNFGKQVVRHGFQLVYGDGSDFSYCRMYTHAKQVWEGFSKNFFPAVAFSPLYWMNALIILILNGVLPFIAALRGPSFTLFWPGLSMALVSWGVRWVQAVQYRFHKGSVFLHPLGCFLFALIGLNSMRWFWLGGAIGRGEHWFKKNDRSSKG